MRWVEFMTTQQERPLIWNDPGQERPFEIRTGLDPSDFDNVTIHEMRRFIEDLQEVDPTIDHIELSEEDVRGWGEIVIRALGRGDHSAMHAGISALQSHIHTTTGTNAVDSKSSWAIGH